MKSKVEKHRSTSLDLKPEPIQWKDIHGLRINEWIYRGQGKANWALDSVLERICRILDGDTGRSREREEALLREFKRRYHHYSVQVPLADDDLEWFSLMQHHGAPTRLLDWSYSIYVAAFFALQEAEEDCSVWMLNTKWAYDHNEAQFEAQDEKAFLKDPIRDTAEHRQLFRRIFIQNEAGKNLISPFAPFRLNERLTLQKGVFVMQTDISKSFEENVANMPGYGALLYEYKLCHPFPWVGRV